MGSGCGEIFTSRQMHSFAIKPCAKDGATWFVCTELIVISGGGGGGFDWVVFAGEFGGGLDFGCGWVDGFGDFDAEYVAWTEHIAGEEDVVFCRG